MHEIKTRARGYLGRDPGNVDFINRIESEAARVAREASRMVRARLEEQWNH